MAPEAMVAVLEIGIAPEAAPHVAPALAAQVHEPEVAPPGSASATGAFTAVDGPALPTTTVYVVLWPGTTEAIPSVLVIDRSAVGFNVSVSVAELFAGVGSVTPAGTATVAVLTRVPVAVATTVAEIVNVAVAPTGRSTVVAMLPLPLPAAHDPPPAGTHVHVTPLNDAGIVSVTVAADTADGPALLATTVYVTDVPGTSVNEPSVFVIDRSAVGFNVSESVAELFPGVGSVTPPGAAIVAVFTNVPVALATTVAEIVNVTDAPTGRFTDALMLPLPLAGHVPPAAPAHVHVTPLNDTGIVSVTVAADTADGPALLATTVYVTDVPGTSVNEPSVFVIDRSAVGFNVSESVAELFPGVGSVEPPGNAIVAVLESDPVALDEIVPVTVNVAVPLGSNVTKALIEPEPDAGHDDPADAVHVHVTPLSDAGIVSATVAPVIVDGPAFEAMIV